MINISNLIQSNKSTEIQNWISSIDSSILLNTSINDLLFISENLYAKTFNIKPLNLTFAQLTVELYDKICLIDSSSESCCFSAVNVRLRVLKESPKTDRSEFFSPRVIIDLIRTKLDAPIDEIRELAKKWQTLKIDQIRKLRSYKMWLKVLRNLETIEGTEYKEFNDWKSIQSILP